MSLLLCPSCVANQGGQPGSLACGHPELAESESSCLAVLQVPTWEPSLLSW